MRLHTGVYGHRKTSTHLKLTLASSDTTEPRYLKIVTVSSFCQFTLISLLMLLVLFAINLVFSALISMP